MKNNKLSNIFSSFKIINIRNISLYEILKEEGVKIGIILNKNHQNE